MCHACTHMLHVPDVTSLGVTYHLHFIDAMYGHDVGMMSLVFAFHENLVIMVHFTLA